MLIMRAYSLDDGAFFAFVSIIRRNALTYIVLLQRKSSALSKLANLSPQEVG